MVELNIYNKVDNTHYFSVSQAKQAAEDEKS